MVLDRGWKIGAAKPVETIRAALVRRDEVFEPVGKGKYALRSWSQEMKRVAKGATG